MTNEQMRRYHDLLDFRLVGMITVDEERELAVLEFAVDAEELAINRERGAEKMARRSLDRLRLLQQEVEVFVSEWKAARWASLAAPRE